MSRGAVLIAALALALLPQPADARAKVRAKPADRSVMALKDPARLVGLGQAMEARGSVTNAFSFYDRALELDPRFAPALRAGGDLALKRGDGPLAFGYFAAWASQVPNSADAFLGMGSALNLRQQPSEALPVLQRAQTLGAAHGAVAAQWGLAFDLLGRQQDAQIAYAEALQANPDDRQTVQRMALSLAISGDRAAALQLLTRYQGEGEAADVRRTLAFVEALTGDMTAAAEIAGKSFPANEARTLTAVYGRLASFSAADRAAAVMLGRMPVTTTSAAVAVASEADADPVAEVPPPGPVRDTAALTIADARAQPRIWVQLASTPDRAALIGEWRRIQREAGTLADGLSVFVERTPKTNRLLVGPFAATDDATALVTKLKAKNIPSLINRAAVGARLEALGLPK